MSPCELCKSAKHKPKLVKQVLTPVFKKDTPENVRGNPSSVQATAVDFIRVTPVDSMIIPQDTLIMPNPSIIDTTRE